MRTLHPAYRSALLILFAAWFGSGCGFVRLYGGHGSEDALRAQIVEANDRLATELIQAEASLELLQARAGGDAELSVLARDYASVVQMHAVLVAEHSEEIDDLLDSPNRLGFIGGYRALNRGLGATVSLANTMTDAYDAITRDVYERVSGESYPAAQTESALYQLIPPSYAAMTSERMTMRDALGG